MSENSNKGISQGRLRFFGWMIIASVVVGLLATLGWLASPQHNEASSFQAPQILVRILVYSGAALVIILLVRFLYRKPLRILRGLAGWLFCWRTLKRGLLALAFLVVLALIFHTEENWRGKRVWENYRREWEAKGERFDFASFIPSPVPDEQNFALTPIVASCYSGVMDRNGRRIEPENTNVVNRLKMDIYRQNLPFATYMRLVSWQKSQLTDLVAWQNYYRTMFVTNFVDERITDMMMRRRRSMPPPGGATPVETPGAETNLVVTITPLATNEFPIAPQAQSPAADVLLALSKFDPAIKELRLASRLPHSRFPLDYATSNPSTMIYPHYGPLTSAAAVLRLRAIAELSAGQGENALADVRLILYLAGSVRNEPSTWSLNLRMKIVDHAIQPIWEGLARQQWSEGQLVALERELVGVDTTSDYSLALRSERASYLKSLDYLRTERRTNSITCMCDDPVFWPTLALRLSPGGWFYMNMPVVARNFQAALPTSAESSQGILSPDIGRRLLAFEKLERSPHWIPDNWALSFIPPLGREAQNCARFQASVDLARVACALERYRLANGSYPESLNALVPTFIPKVPHDIINGQPLHYRRTEDGSFLLYSVGWNEKDDAGEAEAANPFNYVGQDPHGDWVWGYPAK